MRVVIQRVKSSSVIIDNKEKRIINAGLNILLGICAEDTQDDIDWLVRKIVNLRIFPDVDNVMNRSILDLKGEILVISQFTLYASTKKGNRPSYIKSAPPSISEPLYDKFISTLKKESNLNVKTGSFGANMLVEIENDGPVTIIIDTHNKE